MLKRTDCIDRAWRSVLTGFRSFLLPSKVSIVTSPCFQISVHTSRWLHRNFETKLARCTASCNQWILSDLVHNYIACYQHKAVKSSCIRGLLAFSLERLDWSSSMSSTSSLASNAKPPILSEPQYLLCWLITFLIVSKQLKKNRRQREREMASTEQLAIPPYEKVNVGYLTQRNNHFSK